MSNSQFQGSLNKFPAKALVGQTRGVNPVIYALPNAQAKSSLSIGNFVWEEALTNNVLEVSASAKSGEIKPLGIVAHTGGYANTDTSLSASIKVASGQFVDIITRGDIYVSATTSANRGDKVFANIYDGSIEIAEAGSALQDAVETSFSVVEGGNSGSIITISNWV